MIMTRISTRRVEGVLRNLLQLTLNEGKVLFERTENGILYEGIHIIPAQSVVTLSVDLLVKEPEVLVAKNVPP